MQKSNHGISLMLDMQAVCNQMINSGFQYGSMVESFSLDMYCTKPHEMGTPGLKPMAQTLYCSQIETSEYDGVTEVALEWYDFVLGEDYKTDEYSARHLLFVKADPCRITSESDQRFRKNGEWRKETEYFPKIDWSGVASEYAGIVVNPSISSVRDVFPMWDVDTLAVWDAKSCITEVWGFQNAGEWMYKDVGPLSLASL